MNFRTTTSEFPDHGMDQSFTLFEPLMSIREVCEWLNIGETSLRKLKKQKRLVPGEIGRRRLYEPAKVRTYLASLNTTACELPDHGMDRMYSPFEPLMSIREVCEWLNIGETTLRKLKKQKRLIPVKIGRRVLYEPAKVRAYLVTLAGAPMAVPSGSKRTSQPVNQDR